MHGPTCIFWANLTPFSLKEHLLQPGAAELARQNAATNRTGVCPGTPACPGVPINYSPAYSAAGFDEGLLSFSLSKLICIENPYGYRNFSDE